MHMVQHSSHVAARRSLGLILVLVLVPILGCKQEPYQVMPVSGKVTYDDGSPIPADRILVKFVSTTPPADPRVIPRQGTAMVDVKTGTFDSATTYSLKDGIVPGDHKVVIECYSRGSRRLRTDLVPEEYSDSGKTPLTVKSSESPFDLKVRKPNSKAR